ncbi:TFIIB-type zinc ribbon-containing protein [Allostreptomyces psammosilenae]|uniref:TFIIB-type zinc ribbon-containing protein n=1 Tax=Allostreptomyces psammosilenae TaxID=1892865 RepID=UPI0015CE9A73|nr:zf-TFIIB domain-containing protein [Allostreptomyces psammosilenae]
MFQCPKCHGAMRTYNRSGVQIEQCDNCRGIFLDYGELESLSQAEARWAQPAPPPAPGHAPPPPAGYGQPAWGAPHHGGHGHGHGHHGPRSFGRMLFST